MELYTVVKFSPSLLTEIAREKIEDSFKNLSRREKRKAKRERKKGLAIISDARKYEKAKQWAERQSPFSVHQGIVERLSVGFPLGIPYLEFDTGKAKKRKYEKVSKITYSPSPDVKEIKATSVEHFQADYTKLEKRKAVRNALHESEIPVQREDPILLTAKRDRLLVLKEIKETRERYRFRDVKERDVKIESLRRELGQL